MSKVLVYGSPLSTYVRTVILLLESIGIEYQTHSVDFLRGENRLAAYLAKNPFAKMPTLEIDGGLIYETAAITDYLDTVFAGGRFTPTDPLLRARMRQIMGIIDHYLYPHITTIVMQRLVIPSQGGRTDLSAVDRAIDPLKTAIEAIETLVKCDLYLLGSNASIADFYLVPIFGYLAQTQDFAVIMARSPKLQVWWRLCSKSSLVKKVCNDPVTENHTPRQFDFIDLVRFPNQS
jgi:glutathione S-transferase